MLTKYLYHDVNFRGTIDRVTYTTRNIQGELREKYANIYLPYGYDPADKKRRYNILYMMHGGGGNPDAWLDCCKIKNMLDHSIDSKETNPLIVVFPSYYKEKISREGKPDSNLERTLTKSFMRELVSELLPAVEGKYTGYAMNTTDDELRKTRTHRAFGGFSMGSCTTWFAFLNELSYFGEFLPFSGDCWEIEPVGGMKQPENTARVLQEAAAKTGLPFKIFAATGSEDAAFGSLPPQIEAMKKCTNIFKFDEDPAEGNLHFEVADGEKHCYEAANDYLYSYLPYLFL